MRAFIETPLRHGDSGTPRLPACRHGPSEALGTDTVNEFSSADTGDILDFSLLSVSGSTGVNVDVGSMASQTVLASRLILALNHNAGIEIIMGSAHADTLTGNSRNNDLHGGSGDDSIHGASGNDTLWGDGGFDELFGDDGNDLFHSLDNETPDTLYGGDGTDNAADRDLLDDSIPNSDIEILS